MEGALLIVVFVLVCAWAIAAHGPGANNPAIRGVRIQPATWSWVWPEDGVVKGNRILLMPVTSETAAEFWSVQQGDILEINGADPEVTSLVWQAVGAPTAALLFQGQAAIQLCDSAATIIGGISAVLHTGNSIELGIWLAPDQRGIGFGTEALQLAIEHWSSLGYQVRLSTSVGNLAMLRVAEKLGLERVGTEPRTLPDGEVILGANFQLPASDTPSSAVGWG